MTNFQWSKFDEATSFLYAAAPGPEYRIAGEDRPFRFVLFTTYELPIGRGKRLLGDAGKIAGLLAGGWEVAGILNL